MSGSLIAAAGLLAHDPVPILLPSSALLLLEVATGLVAHRAVTGLSSGWTDPAHWRAAVGMFGGWLALRTVLRAPFRALLVAAGARAAGQPASGLRRSLAVLGVDLITSALQACAAGLMLGPTFLLAFGLLSGGYPSSALVALAGGVVLAQLAAQLVRAWLAYAPAIAVLGGAGGLVAVRRASRVGSPELLRSLAILVSADLTAATGGLACGAGALPGYPIGHLALLHRWVGFLGASPRHAPPPFPR